MIFPVKAYRLLAMSILLSLGCSTSEKITNNLSVNVVQTSVDAWFDLIPGTSPGKFHLTGEIKLLNSNSVDIENLHLNTITVYSNTEVIYNFEPYFNPRFKKDDYSLKTGGSKEFIFGTESGMKIDSQLIETNVCDVKLSFTFDEGNFIYQIKDIEIKRAY